MPTAGISEKNIYFSKLRLCDFVVAESRWQDLKNFEFFLAKFRNYLLW